MIYFNSKNLDFSLKFSSTILIELIASIFNSRNYFNFLVDTRIHIYCTQARGRLSQSICTKDGYSQSIYTAHRLVHRAEKNSLFLRCFRSSRDYSVMNAFHIPHILCTDVYSRHLLTFRLFRFFSIQNLLTFIL